ncbi:MAG: sporulation initiation factor Spo0A C-terminal domain-containing protein [Christensenella sp.]
MLKESIDVLLIDDDVKIMSETRRYLAAQENVARVDCAEMAREGIEYCELHPYDIVVVDLVMPENDGFVFLKNMCGTAARALNVIVVSAISSEPIIRRAFSMGVKYYMIKPYKSDVLYQRICDVIHFDEEKLPKGEIIYKGKGLELCVSELLMQIGVPPHLKGHQYLKEAVKLTVENRMMVYSITKEIYPRVAKMFGVKAAQVELAIRHAIEIMYERDRLAGMCDVLGFPLSALLKRPTNGEVIALIADKLMCDENING